MGEIRYDKENETVTWRQSVEVLEKQSIGWRMVENNRMEGIIPFVYYYVDEEVCFCYSVKQVKSIMDIIQKKCLGFQEIYGFCNGILQVICVGEEYLLLREEYLILPEYLFWDPYEKKICICYLPGRERGQKEDFLVFVELLMKKVDHNDLKAVEFIYGLYDELVTKEFELQRLLDYVDSYADKIEKGTALEKSLSEKQCYYLIPQGKNQENTKYTDMRKYILKSISKTNCKLYEKENKIGREDSADITLPFPEISKMHASIWIDGSKIFVTDYNSKNGTYINGRKLSANLKTQCTPKDILTFADISFRLEA